MEVNATGNQQSRMGEKMYELSFKSKMLAKEPESRSLRSLYEEIKAIVPLHDILTWLIGHCIDDQDMIELMDKLQVCFLRFNDSIFSGINL